MKRILLFVLACGLLLCCLAQTPVSNIESSGSWKVTPAKGIQKNMGRFDLSFPPGVDWSVDVYTSGKKFITNHSLKDQRNAGDKRNYYDLAPGIYHFKLNSVMVENVPIEKGNITRLNMGIMEVTSNGKWELRSGNQNKFLTSGNEQRKFALPTGIYILKIGSESRRIEITESDLALPKNLKTFEGAYVMTPHEEGQGRLITRFPEASQNGFFAIFYPIRISKAGETNPIHVCGGSNSGGQACGPHYPLPDGKYDIRFGVAGNGQTNTAVLMSNIPVKKGFETRLRVGYLVHLTKGIYNLYDESKLTHYLRYDQQGSAPMPLPIGNYLIEMPGMGQFNITIKDGEKTYLKPLDSIASPTTLWKNSESKEKMILKKNGRLNCFFPKAEVQKLRLGVKNPNGAYDFINLDSVKFHDVAPDTYRVKLNDIDVDLPIVAGSVSSIRHGYVKVVHTLDVLWEIEPLSGGNNSCFGKDEKTRALPVGFYRLKVPSISGAVREYYFIIREDEMMSLNPDFHHEM